MIRGKPKRIPLRSPHFPLYPKPDAVPERFRMNEIGAVPRLLEFLFDEFIDQMTKGLGLFDVGIVP